MLGNVALYIANRAASGAVGSVTRWASWGAAAALFAAIAVVFVVCAVFWGLVPRFGAVQAAGLVAGSCFALALLMISIPAILDAMERQVANRERQKAGAVATAVTVVNKETEAAVDYFGPLQVVASAFLVGMRTAQQLRPAQTKPAKS